jgi:hypothetical protein
MHVSPAVRPVPKQAVSSGARTGMTESTLAAAAKSRGERAVVCIDPFDALPSAAGRDET